MDKPPQATAMVVDGKLVIDDPAAEAVEAVLRAVGEANCQSFLEANAERVEHFEKRMIELGRSVSDTVIVVLNDDDATAHEVIQVLMPDHDFSAYRDAGAIPVARGLATRAFMEEVLSLLNSRVHADLVATNCQAAKSAVVVMTVGGAAAVFARME